MKNTGICIVSLLGGVIVGSALTMLFAPQSGRDFRHSIKHFVDKEIDKACACHHEKEEDTDE